MAWFDVDKEGLAQLLERRGKAFVVMELVSNAWDEPGVTSVEVTLEPILGRPRARLAVTDDAPEGFADIRHAWTLFAPSRKKADPAARGRFNLGEKLVLALCDEAEIVSTSGAVRFDGKGRQRLGRRREKGSSFAATVRLTRQEMAEVEAALFTMIPPPGITTLVNGRPLERRKPVATVSATLPTEISGEDGRLARTARITDIEIYEPADGESPSIYEMGIPVVEHEGRWHCNVLQKVPLNMDRDNVTPAYRRQLHALVLDAMADRLSEGEAGRSWVRDSMVKASPEAVRAVVEKRFGSRAVIYDPSDREASKRLADEGWQVIPGRALSAEEWHAIKRADAMKPAGQVRPSGIPTSPDGQPPIPPSDWTPDMQRLAQYTREVSVVALGFACGVRFQNLPPGSGRAGCHGAWWGHQTLTFNLGRLGKRWPETVSEEELDRLLIHEMAHHHASDHLSREFYDACCRIGAKLRRGGPLELRSSAHEEAVA